MTNAGEHAPGATASGAGEQLQRALELGYAYLNRRDRTVREVRLQLQRKGVSEELTEAALRTLGEQGFLDDDRFARLFVSDKRELAQWGNERIMPALLARGIGRELAAAALEAEAADEDGRDSELDRALALLRRRFPTLPEDRRERERALGDAVAQGLRERAGTRRAGRPRPRRLNRRHHDRTRALAAAPAGAATLDQNGVIHRFDPRAPRSRRRCGLLRKRCAGYPAVLRLGQ